MNRALCCLAGLAVLMVLGLSLPAAAEEVQPLSAVSTDELVQLLNTPAEGASESSVPEPFLAAAFSCPSYTIACTTNAGCDAYCGTPGWGVCQWMGSAHRRCCFCLG